jgi:hypothetical protein
MSRTAVACALALTLCGCERSTHPAVSVDAAPAAQAATGIPDGPSQDLAGGPGAPCDDWRPDDLIGPGGMMRRERFRLCRPGLTCEIPAGACGGPGSSSPGVCLARPAACPIAAVPVCGCDGRTYDSDCERMTAGVALLAPGACPPARPEERCGGPAHVPCAADLFCDTGWGYCPNVAAPDAAGSCRSRADSCNHRDGPVCGCDGKTYDSDCLRAAAGVPRHQYGRCDVDCNEFPRHAAALITAAAASVDPQCTVDADCKLLSHPGQCIDCFWLAGNEQVAAAIAAQTDAVETLCHQFDAAGCVVIPSGCPGSPPYRCQQGRCVP